MKPRLEARPSQFADPESQTPLNAPAFDTWREPDGGTIATFHRVRTVILVRFPGIADFEVDTDTRRVKVIPVSRSAISAASVLLENSIAPLLANHAGGTNLHGSASAIGGRGVAFLGVSRRGKSTLAGAFMRRGHPLLTEDVLDLERGETGWLVRPHPGSLRLFADSAANLGFGASRAGKAPVCAASLTRANETVPLAAIYMLGEGASGRVTIESLSPADALAELLRHAFVLDVEDHAFLISHFERLAELAAAIPCRRLDYPRRYDVLPQVVAAVVDDLAQT